MNKDLDERLIPDGEYRDATNIQISSTESDDAGTVQNILGNKAIYTNTLGGTCLALIENPETEKIYMFIKGTSVHGILEYNQTTDTTRPLIVDNRNTKVLDFTNVTKITGITILDDFLIFTDNNSEPKIINISDTSNFLTDSTYSSTVFDTTSKLNGNNFVEHDITLIKRKPHNAPGVRIEVPTATKNSDAIYKDKFVRFAYRFKFTNSQCSPISPFTQSVFLPNTTNSYDIDEGYNEQMENNITNVKLFDFDVSSNDLESIDIIYKESNNTNIYLYASITKAEATTANTSGFDVSKTVKKRVIPENQLLRAFDNVPYRAKAVDVVGNRIVFGNYKDGINISNYTPTFSIVQLIGRNTIDAELTRKINITGQTLLQSGVGSNTATGLYDTRTVKTGRKYEVGIVFEDKFGRQTPVITSAGGTNPGTLDVDFDTGTVAGKKLQITMGGSAPTDSRITRYKYFVKASSNKYDNLIVETAKLDKEDSGTCWLVVPSYEINKVKEGQYMMLKKALNTNSILSYGTPADPDNFKFKILDISSTKPINIDAVESFDGKFFIKIKKTSEITTNIFNNQGLAGKNGEILEIDFKQGSSSSITNALFLGQALAPDSEDRIEVSKFYFKDGKIYEVVNTVDASTSGINPTFTSSVVGESAGSSSYADLAGHTQGSIPSSGLAFVDSTGTVTKAEVKYNTSNFPTSFQITYQSQNSGTGVAADTSPAVFETIPEDEVLDVYFETEESFDISTWGQAQDISWHNAYIMGNGVESSVVNDDFNEDRVEAGVKVSTTISGEYNQRDQKSSLIYSGIFNAENGVNKLNEFNPALKITKELNPEYGSIQKLHTRNTDIIALCEDKILRVLANKDALFNADGNVNLTATENVLGQAIAFNGDYGISRNPESFANYGYRSYFTDKARGVVLRLSRDGLTVISAKGMVAFFRENLINETGLILGSYDIYSDQYILTMPVYNTSISFKENVDGWVSRLSFIPDAGVSLNGEYYTCYSGTLYQHNVASEPRNTFYNVFKASGIKLILNQDPSAIKNFKNIIYEGTTGWTTDTNKIDIIHTDQQDGQIIEFVEKEGKYFGYIAGVDTKLDTISGDELNSRIKDFSIQGLGNIKGVAGTQTFNCTDANFSVSNGATGVTTSTLASVSNGTITSISPSTLASGASQYTATILVPNGYSNSGLSITCLASATGTDTDVEFTSAIANLSIPDGTVGATVSGTVSVGSIASISPTTYAEGLNTYTATITIPGSGYTNSGTITATDTATGTFGSCAFSLSTNAYDTDHYELTGTFSGTDYTDSDTISLSVDSGNIGIGSAGSSSSVNTTKSALAGTLTIYSNEAVNITATITSGLCSQKPETATVQAPQTASAVISGVGTAFVGQNITLTANVTGTLTSIQWHKSTSSGFTVANSNAITGATSTTLVTTESTADTIYYKVVVNGNTGSPSAQHVVIWSAWTTHSNLKYISGTARNAAACTSTTLVNLFGNGTFTAATQFAVDNQGSTSGFQQGTYSDGTNNRFISSAGVPQAHVACSGDAGFMGIKASSCDDANNDKYFFVDLASVSGIAVDKVISFTDTAGGSLVAQFGKNYWVVEEINLELDSSQYDATPVLRTVANSGSCLSLNPNTVSLTALPATASVGSTVTLTATPSFTPQGATLTYIYRKSTDGSTPSTIVATTTSTTATDTLPSTAGTNQYTVEIQGTSPLIISTVRSVTATANSLHSLRYHSDTGSINSDACVSTTFRDVYAALAPASNTDQTDKLANPSSTSNLYVDAAGNTSGFVGGTYSDGNVHGYFSNTGVLQNQWVVCTTTPNPSTLVVIESTQSSSNFNNANPNQGITLEAIPSNYPDSSQFNFSWTQTSSSGSAADSFSSSTVLSTTSTFTAELSTAEKTNIGTGSIMKRFSCSVNDGPTATGTPTTTSDNIEVTWVGITQNLEVVPCVGSGTHYIKVINTGGLQNDQVINITHAGSTPADGCYKITNASSSGESYISVSVAGDYPFAPSTTCCACSTCTASISGNEEGTVGTAVELSASPSGFSVNQGASDTKYTWYVSYDSAALNNSSHSSWDIKTDAANDGSPLFNAASPGPVYYRVTITGFNSTTTGVTANAYHTIVWSPQTSSNNSYKLRLLNQDCTETDTTDYFASVTGSFVLYEVNDVVSRVDGTATCYRVIEVLGTYSSSYPEIAVAYSNCDVCYEALLRDCSISMTSGSTYNSGAGTATFTAVIGSSAAATDTISLAATDGSTVSPTSTTVAALEGGLIVTIGSGKILEATITSGTCINTNVTAQAPVDNCHEVPLYYHTQNPATNASAKSALCGSSSARNTRINSSSLATATQVYADSACSTLKSGTVYLSENNTQYYIWNGYSLSSAINLNCESGDQI